MPGVFEENALARIVGGVKSSMRLSPAEVRTVQPWVSQACRDARFWAILGTIVCGVALIGVAVGVFLWRGVSRNALLDNTTSVLLGGIVLGIIMGVCLGFTIIMPLLARSRFDGEKELFDCYWGTEFHCLPRRMAGISLAVLLNVLAPLYVFGQCSAERVDEGGILAGSAATPHGYHQIVEMSLEHEAAGAVMRPRLKIRFDDEAVVKFHDFDHGYMRVAQVLEYVTQRTSVIVRKGKLLP